MFHRTRSFQNAPICIAELGQKPKRAFNTSLTITDLRRMEMMKKNMYALSDHMKGVQNQTKIYTLESNLL